MSFGGELNGEGFVVEAMSRPPLLIDHLWLASPVASSPIAIRSLDGDEDGMYARFLFVGSGAGISAALGRDLGGRAGNLERATRLIDLPAGEEANLFRAM